MLVTGFPLNVFGIFAVVMFLYVAATRYELPSLFSMKLRLPEVSKPAASTDNDSAQQTETATASVISRQIILFFIVFFLSLINFFVGQTVFFWLTQRSHLISDYTKYALYRIILPL